MCPKASSLKTLRAQTKARQKLVNVTPIGSKGDSAYDTLKKANQDLKYGKRMRDEDDGCEEQEAVRELVVKKVKVVKKKVTAVKAKKPTKPKEPVIEQWRPAGGENPLKRRGKKDGQPTCVLGIARVSSWRVGAVSTAVKTLIKQHGQMEELTTTELVHGGESVTDIFVTFRSDLAAEVVKDGIDGEMVEGRKLQVRYSQLTDSLAG